MQSPEHLYPMTFLSLYYDKSFKSTYTICLHNSIYGINAWNMVPIILTTMVALIIEGNISMYSCISIGKFYEKYENKGK